MMSLGAACSGRLKRMTLVAWPKISVVSVLKKFLFFVEKTSLYDHTSTASPTDSRPSFLRVSRKSSTTDFLVMIRIGGKRPRKLQNFCGSCFCSHSARPAAIHVLPLPVPKGTSAPLRLSLYKTSSNAAIAFFCWGLKSRPPGSLMSIVE